MSITSLRPISRTTAAAVHLDAFADHRQPAASGIESFGMALLRAGRISAQVLTEGISKPQVPLIDHLLASGHLTEDDAYAALAAHWAVGRADFVRHPINAALLGHVDPAECLSGAWVPWRKLGPTTVIACAYPEAFADLRARLTPIFGPVSLALAPRRVIAAQVLARAGAALARRAETRLPDRDSCRAFSPRRAAVPLAMVVFALIVAWVFNPIALLGTVLGFALVLADAQIVMKLLATAATLLPAKSAPLNRLPPPSAQSLHLVPGTDLPVISIMVPLYRESRIVARLIRRLERLDYPRAKLEIILLTEDNDRATAAALASLNLPYWVRALPVPTGTIRTKPRALNYGLDHCRGQIIGVYDAEDAPDCAQLHAVAAGFAAGDARLACLQGRLDYYNPRSNWLSRCFTIEYATWWRVVLPGFARMGFAIPLGGTTLFFRADILRNLGGWDAHNVTEDADLGLRLSRRGFETQLFDSTTYEEANCRPLPWIKQRSRWIKGYIMTYAAHMRSPAILMRDLGPWRFFGMQMMFAGSVLQALFAPALLAMWLVPFGFLDLSQLGMSPILLYAIATIGLFSEVVMYLVSYLALTRAGHRLNPLWIPTMMIYNLLASLAAYKAVYEVMTAPFYWDKTAHGLFDT